MLFKSCVDVHATAAAILVFLWRHSASLGLSLRKEAQDTSALGFSNFFKEKIYFLAVRGLCCYTQASLFVASGVLVVVGLGLPIVEACHSEASSRACGQASVVLAHGRSDPPAGGVLLGQGLNPCPLHEKAVLNSWATREALDLTSLGN